MDFAPASPVARMLAQPGRLAGDSGSGSEFTGSLQPFSGQVHIEQPHPGTAGVSEEQVLGALDMLAACGLGALRADGEHYTGEQREVGLAAYSNGVMWRALELHGVMMKAGGGRLRPTHGPSALVYLRGNHQPAHAHGPGDVEKLPLGLGNNRHAGASRSGMWPILVAYRPGDAALLLQPGSRAAAVSLPVRHGGAWAATPLGLGEFGHHQLYQYGAPVNSHLLLHGRPAEPLSGMTLRQELPAEGETAEEALQLTVACIQQAQAWARAAGPPTAPGSSDPQRFG